MTNRRKRGINQIRNNLQMKLIEKIMKETKMKRIYDNLVSFILYDDNNNNNDNNNNDDDNNNNNNDNNNSYHVFD